MNEVDLEERLRRALAARADGVTAPDLRPVVVAERRGTRVRWWLPLSAGLAATAVVMLIFVVFHRPSARPAPGRPVVPAASVPASRPAPTVSRTASVIPSPAASAPASVPASVPPSAPASASAPVGPGAEPSLSGAAPGWPGVSPSAGRGLSSSAGAGRSPTAGAGH